MKKFEKIYVNILDSNIRETSMEEKITEKADDRIEHNYAYNIALSAIFILFGLVLIYTNFIYMGISYLHPLSLLIFSFGFILILAAYFPIKKKRPNKIMLVVSVASALLPLSLGIWMLFMFDYVGYNPLQHLDLLFITLGYLLSGTMLLFAGHLRYIRGRLEIILGFQEKYENLDIKRIKIKKIPSTILLIIFTLFGAIIILAALHYYRFDYYNPYSLCCFTTGFLLILSSYFTAKKKTPCTTISIISIIVGLIPLSGGILILQGTISNMINFRYFYENLLQSLALLLPGALLIFSGHFRFLKISWNDVK